MNRKQRRAAGKIARKQPKDASPQAAADNLVEKAIAAARLGAFADAESALDEVLAHFPDHIEALHQKGMLLARTDRVEEGVTLLERVTAKKPGEALYWNNLAAARLTINRSAEAQIAARKAVELDRKYAMAWRNLAMASADLDRHRDAAEALEKASTLTPNDPEIWSQLGLARIELEDSAQAEAAFAKAAALDPKNAECLSNLGGLMVKRGRAADALQHLERAVAIEPDRFTAALHYGVALAMTGDLAKGLRWLRRATSIKPRSDAAWAALADAASTAGEKAEALDAAQRAAELAPSDPSHRVRVQKLESDGAEPRSTLVELDLGSPTPAREQAKDVDLSRSLGQIFIG
jgi:Flp pilus assembly protein TadD